MLFGVFVFILNRREVRTKISSEKNESQISKAEEGTEMQWRIQDFSTRRGRQLPRGAPTSDFAAISLKLREIERIWTRVGVRTL